MEKYYFKFRPLEAIAWKKTGLMDMKRILVVDDEEAILLALKKLLKRPNIEIDTAESLEHVLALLQHHSYAIVIADLRLSGTFAKEGFQVLEHVKKGSPATIVVLITAYGNVEIRERAQELGADYYFEKPFNMNDLYDIVNKIDQGR